MKTAIRLVGMFVVVSLLTGALARGDTPVMHVSTMTPYCNGKGFCARTSNGERTSMLPAYTINPVKFNAVDGEPIQ